MKELNRKLACMLAYYATQIGFDKFWSETCSMLGVELHKTYIFKKVPINFPKKLESPKRQLLIGMLCLS